MISSLLLSSSTLAMLFNSFTYLLFLPLVVALYWVLPAGARRVLLLVASYIFYMHWMPAYGLLILGLTVGNYWLGLALDRFPDHKRPILVVSLVFNLGVLCFFKYANFLLRTALSVAHATMTFAGFSSSLSQTDPALNILLPLGISFFTFEFIASVEIWVGEQKISRLAPVNMDVAGASL